MDLFEAGLERTLDPNYRELYKVFTARPGDRLTPLSTLPASKANSYFTNLRILDDAYALLPQTRLEPVLMHPKLTTSLPKVSTSLDLFDTGLT